MVERQTNDPLNYLGVRAPQPPNFVQSTNSPTSSDTGFDIGTVWLNTTSKVLFSLVDVAAGIATWSPYTAGGGPQVETLTGDSGGAVGPDGAANIDILGSPDIGMVGTPGSNSFQMTNLTKTTEYIIDPTLGDSPFSTIQAALDDIGASGQGQIFLRAGTYTEDLVFPDGIEVGILAFGDEDAAPGFIVGQHTPPDTGFVVVWRVKMTSTGDLFNSNSAGTASIVLAHNNFAVNGYLFNCPNWTSSGSFVTFAIGDRLSTASGIVNNTAGTGVFLFQSALGVGNTFPCILSGFTDIQLSVIGCPVTIQGSAVFQLPSVRFQDELTITGDATGDASSCKFIPVGATPAITYSSTGDFAIANSNITTSNSPAIDGTATGLLTLGNVYFFDNQQLSPSLPMSPLHYELRGTGQTVGAVTADLITYELRDANSSYHLIVQVSGSVSVGNLGVGVRLVTLVKTDGATATVVGGVDDIVNSEGAIAAATATVVASGNSLIVRATGVAANTIEWSSNLSFEMITS